MSKSGHGDNRHWAQAATLANYATDTTHTQQGTHQGTRPPRHTPTHLHVGTHTCHATVAASASVCVSHWQLQIALQGWAWYHARGEGNLRSAFLPLPSLPCHSPPRTPWRQRYRVTFSIMTQPRGCLMWPGQTAHRQSVRAEGDSDSRQSDSDI